MMPDESRCAAPAHFERLVQRALFRERKGACSLIMPNYTPHGWFECDCWAVTKAGYGVEWEVKRTVADFRADATKRRLGPLRQVEPGRWRRERGQTKYERLAAADTRGPSRFWYVVPPELVNPAEVPEWAGLMHARYSPDWDWTTLTIIRQAPRLHRQLVPPKVIEHARGVCYWRYWHELIRNNPRHAHAEAVA